MTIDSRLAELQSGQLGLVTIAQARDADVSYAALRRRRRRGRADRCDSAACWRAPTAPDTFERRLLAGVLAAGPTAFASHESAAHLWGLPLLGAGRDWR